jgi:hypothetical protein
LTTETVYRASNYTFNTAAAEAKSWRHVRANCMGHAPFVEWLEQIIRGRLQSGLYDGFSLDGDFAGGPGFTGLRCRCHAENHDHLAGDANYACQRAVACLLARIRRDFPDCYIWLMRPMMEAAPARESIGIGLASVANIDNSTGRQLLPTGSAVTPPVGLFLSSHGAAFGRPPLWSANSWCPGKGPSGGRLR